MSKKDFLDVIGLFSILLWIPLAIAAFFLSPVRIDIKLSIAAGASLLAMLIFGLRNDISNGEQKKEN